MTRVVNWFGQRFAVERRPLPETLTVRVERPFVLDGSAVQIGDEFTLSAVRAMALHAAGKVSLK